MNAKKFSDAMSELDTKYVDEALNYNKEIEKACMGKVGSYGSLSLSYNLCSCNSSFA